VVVKSSGFYGKWWNNAVVFSKSDRTKYHHFPMLFFPMNINYKKWWHKAVVLPEMVVKSGGFIQKWWNKVPPLYILQGY